MMKQTFKIHSKTIIKVTKTRNNNWLFLLEPLHGNVEITLKNLKNHPLSKRNGCFFQDAVCQTFKNTFRTSLFGLPPLLVCDRKWSLSPLCHRWPHDRWREGGIRNVLFVLPPVNAFERQRLKVVSARPRSERSFKQIRCGLSGESMHAKRGKHVTNKFQKGWKRWNGLKNLLTTEAARAGGTTVVRGTTTSGGIVIGSILAANAHLSVCVW